MLSWRAEQKLEELYLKITFTSCLFSTVLYCFTRVFIIMCWMKLYQNGRIFGVFKISHFSNVVISGSI